MQNKMMDRPVVKEGLVEYMRNSQRQFDGDLGKLQEKCKEDRVPIIPHETAVFLDFQLSMMNVNRILEIGTAVGFSAMLMARYLPEDGELITIERSPHMIDKARDNVERMGFSDKIKIIYEDAKDALPKIEGQFDLVFMDSAKSKYIEYFPYCMKLLKKGGIMIVDDIFQGGTILDDIMEIPRRDRTIHKKLNMFLDFVNSDDAIKSTLVPLGDGIVMIRKEKEKDYMFILEKLEKPSVEGDED